MQAGARRAWRGRKRRRVCRAPAARAGPPTRRTGAPPHTASPAQRFRMHQALHSIVGDLPCHGAAALHGGTGCSEACRRQLEGGEAELRARTRGGARLAGAFSSSAALLPPQVMRSRCRRPTLNHSASERLEAAGSILG